MLTLMTLVLALMLMHAGSDAGTEFNAEWAMVVAAGCLGVSAKAAGSTRRGSTRWIVYICEWPLDVCEPAGIDTTRRGAASCRPWSGTGSILFVHPILNVLKDVVYSSLLL